MVCSPYIIIVYFIAPVLVLIYGDCERCLERVRGVVVAEKVYDFHMPIPTPTDAI